MQFPSTVQGIPCQIHVIEYRQDYYPMNNEPPEPGVCAYQILDRRGNQAAWLERKATPDDYARIDEEIQIMQEGDQRQLYS